jgi:Ca2+-binding EF-hand superfamily protein
MNMNDVYKAFDWCDVDHNGVLDAKEIAKALRLAGQNPTQAEFRKLKATFDQDGNGLFDFQEFTNVICRTYVSPDEMRRKAMEAFAVFDADNSGSISLIELRRILTTYGEDMSDEEVSFVFIF